MGQQPVGRSISIHKSIAMKREEERKRAASNYVEKLGDGLHFESPISRARFHAHINGAVCADIRMLDKACEWLYNALYTRANGAEHYVASKEKITQTEFVAKFRKAMEE